VSTASAGAAPDVTAVGDALAAAGEQRIGLPITLQPLGLGASRECWLITAGQRRYVLKRDPLTEQHPATSRLREYLMVSAARAVGVPVARPVCAEPAGGRFGSAGFVTEFVNGTSSPRKILDLDEQAATRLLRQLGGAVARLSRIDPTAGAHAVTEYRAWQVSASPGASDAVPAILDGLGAALDELAPDRPAFALALRWAELNRPAPVPPVVVHGDFRLGNVIVHESGVAALVDWEFARYGDIAEDLAFFCLRPWQFGRHQYPAGGIGSRQTLLDGYAEITGVDIPLERMHYWEVVNQIRWGVYCLQQAAGYSAGEHHSLERLVLGRRATEAEWDALSLIAERMHK
jgi:aminoglycoside phosphotransferase (APT) family kinase protein